MIRGAREGEWAVAAARVGFVGVRAICWPQLEQVDGRALRAAYSGSPPHEEHPPVDLPLAPPVKLPQLSQGSQQSGGSPYQSPQYRSPHPLPQKAPQRRNPKSQVKGPGRRQS